MYVSPDIIRMIISTKMRGAGHAWEKRETHTGFGGKL
jgi:hypothetical protein